MTRPTYIIRRILPITGAFFQNILYTSLLHYKLFTYEVMQHALSYKHYINIIGK